MSNDVYKDDCEIEVIALSSKYDAIGQNAFIGFSSSALNFHGPK